jgi:uncharacterized integral membrane protein
MSDQVEKPDGKRIGGGAIASLVGLAVLVIFIVQNRETIEISFLMWTFSWPLWVYTIVMAVVGAMIWFGLGVMRRRKRRKARRD